MFGLDEMIGSEDLEDASSADPDTLRAFVVAAVYANAAVLLVSLGPMGWFFQGWSRLALALFAGGLLAGARSYWTYRSWKRSKDAAESDSGTDAGDDGAGLDPDAADLDPDADASPPEA